MGDEVILSDIKSTTAIIKDLFHPDGTSAGFYVEEVEGVIRTFDNSNDVIYKRCMNPECNALKPLSDFYKASHMKDGYGSRCKACHSKTASNYQKTVVKKKRIKDYGFGV